MGDHRAVKVISVFALLVIGVVMIATRARRVEGPALEGYFAPDFSLPMLGGGEARLRGSKGKVVLVNIWASWCKPCVEEIPSLEALYTKEKERGFEILAVNIDTSGHEAVEKFIRRFSVSFPVLLDPSGTIGRLYGITGVPESFLVNKKGMIAEKVIGPRDWTHPHSLMMLDKLLGEEA